MPPSTRHRARQRRRGDRPPSPVAAVRRHPVRSDARSAIGGRGGHPAEDAGQRVHNLRDILDGLRWPVRSGAPWRYLPKDFPPWSMVYQQTRRWLAAGCFEAIVHDLRAVLRFAAGRDPEPTAAILDGRTLQSTPESGGRAGYDGAKKRKGSKVHVAVDTLGHLLALHVTPANEQDRAQVGVLAEAVQAVTGESVELAFVDRLM